MYVIILYIYTSSLYRRIAFWLIFCIALYPTLIIFFCLLTCFLPSFPTYSPTHSLTRVSLVRSYVKSVSRKPSLSTLTPNFGCTCISFIFVAFTLFCSFLFFFFFFFIFVNMGPHERKNSNDSLNIQVFS